MQHVRRFIQILSNFFSNLFLEDKFVSVKQDRRITSRITRRSRTIIGINVLTRRLLSRVQLVNSRIIRTSTRRFTNVLFTISNPYKSHLTTLVSLLRRAKNSGNKLCTRRVYNERVMVATRTRYGSVTNPSLQYRLLSLTRNFVALQNSNTILHGTFFTSSTSNFHFRLQNNNVKLSLGIRLSLAFTRIRRFFRYKGFNADMLLTRPTPNVRLTGLIVNRIMSILITTNTTTRTNVINRRSRTILNRLRVRLNPLTTLVSNRLRDKRNIFQYNDKMTTIHNSCQHGTTRRKRRLIISKRNGMARYRRGNRRDDAHGQYARGRPTNKAIVLSTLSQLQLEKRELPRTTIRRNRSHTLHRNSNTISRRLRRERLGNRHHTKRYGRNLYTLRPSHGSSTMRQRNGHYHRRRKARSSQRIPTRRRGGDARSTPTSTTGTFLCQLPRTFTLRRRRQRRRRPTSARRRRNNANDRVRRMVPTIYPSSARSMFQRNGLHSVIVNRRGVNRQSRRNAMSRGGPILQRRYITSVYGENTRRNERTSHFTLTNGVRPVRRSKGLVRHPRHNRSNGRHSTRSSHKKKGSVKDVIITRMIRKYRPRHRQPRLLRRKSRRRIHYDLVRSSSHRREGLNTTSSDPNKILRKIMNFIKNTR